MATIQRRRLILSNATSVDPDQVIYDLNPVRNWDVTKSNLINLNGSNVVSIADTQSGVLASQSVASSQPLLTTDANGRPVIRFDGNNDFLSADDFYQSAITVYTVSRSIGGTGQQHILRKGLSAINGELEYLLRYDNATTIAGFINASATLSRTISVTNGGIHLSSLNYDNSSLSVTVNGSNSSISATGNLQNGASTLRIGASRVDDTPNSSPTFVLNGDIYQILIFPYSLGVIQDTTVINRLIAKHNL